MNNLDKHIIIKCPKCGAEYLASEIFYPEDLLGSCKNILRDENNKIIMLEDGEEPSLEEDWECYNCGCNFKASLSIKGSSLYNSNYDFSEDYTIKAEDDKEKLF
jgi:DNA-directed RNA polymerase subunit M/transcription elongation factor TFIIS